MKNKIICMVATSNLKKFEAIGFEKTVYFYHDDYCFSIGTKRIYFNTRNYKIYFNQVNKEVLMVFQQMVLRRLIKWVDPATYEKEIIYLKAAIKQKEMFE